MVRPKKDPATRKVQGHWSIEARAADLLRPVADQHGLTMDQLISQLAIDAANALASGSMPKTSAPAIFLGKTVLSDEISRWKLDRNAGIIYGVKPGYRGSEVIDKEFMLAYGWLWRGLTLSNGTTRKYEAYRAVPAHAVEFAQRKDDLNLATLGQALNLLDDAALTYELPTVDYRLYRLLDDAYDAIEDKKLVTVEWLATSGRLAALAPVAAPELPIAPDVSSPAAEAASEPEPEPVEAAVPLEAISEPEALDTQEAVRDAGRRVVTRAQAKSQFGVTGGALKGLEVGGALEVDGGKITKAIGPSGNQLIFEPAIALEVI